MALPPPPPTTQPTLCTICLSPLGNSHSSRQPLPVFPCSHMHCLACLRRNFVLSITCATPFRPVQCCPGQRLATSLLRQCLSLGSSELSAYRTRLAEYDAKAKLYCHDPKCGRFIPIALRSRRVGKCRRCYGKTCVECRGRAHFGRCQDHLDEVEDETGVAKTRRPVSWGDEVRFKKTAREMGWKQCPECGRWVEKTLGCNHISCICGCDFCYHCGRAHKDHNHYYCA
ncbi:uncharacterized protein B0T15DRAFT_66750 [Chaetomium strumarium]|uniref:RBR-type E3 ubiquitin transferase n=1 Tax=Chaetomium strumarium TaxID=1170767 RepID=A0AAJ0H478_9PEZI|nr:hypothetical protein B0T15DRAFT_66750 [Chaetomium strumarium]